MRLLPLLFCCIVAVETFAQSSGHVEGQVLVQMHPEQNPRLLEDADFPVPVKVVEQVSVPMRVWLVTFPAGTLPESHMVEHLWNHPAVEKAQVNHRLEFRDKQPGDSLYYKQWQYMNNGSTGGTKRADIRAEEAWGITTGGVTAWGDTIVIAVVDDGIDSSHTDFNGNLWVNWHEVPNNGLDDDSNGFVDDYRGWNAYQGNDDIHSLEWLGTSHGTPVAGIVGARGDNLQGVAGVNWNVKMMTVVGGGTEEADALKAYSYVWEMRRLWNRTNGQKGAFIVSVNSSWGDDGGRAQEAPLWCSVYDSMGAEGILNVAATTNSERDIDRYGDLPTTCPSSYLVSVTNTDHNDLKATAGYGRIHVDLGAPGEDVYTVASKPWDGRHYSRFAGTSAASPHVAGAVGLLYAHACEDFLDVVENDPQQAALLAKDFILNGTDSLPALANITVSSGRLNLHKMLMEVNKFCGRTAIQEPKRAEGKLAIFPNPAHDQLTVQLPEHGRYRLSLLNVLGRTVLQQQLSGAEVILSLDGLPDGVYFVRVENEATGSLSTTKVVKR